jgi:ATP-dependent exoDNAse (exonuclease V) beta subunit
MVHRGWSTARFQPRINSLVSAKESHAVSWQLSGSVCLEHPRNGGRLDGVTIGETLAPARQPSSEQHDAIHYFGGNVYVGAGPGAGKTFLLVERVRALRAQGVPVERILVITFSRRATLELAGRIREAGLGAIDVRTFHGFAARALGGGLARFREMRLLDPFSRRLVLELAIAATPTPTLGAAARSSATFVDDLLHFFADLGRIDDRELVAIAADASPRVRDLLAVRAADAMLRVRAGGGDLDDLVRRTIVGARIAGSPTQQWLKGRYDDVLVDEFQDSDREQLALLELLDARLFAVGDEAQSIYRFRGASDAIVPHALVRFAMRRFDLMESRRCPPAVCQLASRTPLPALIPLRSSRAEGEPVAIHRYATVDDEVAALADDIEREVDYGRPDFEIAVLLRAFRPFGPLITAELEQRGIPVTAMSRETLLADPRVAVLCSALRLFARPTVADLWCELLASPVLRLDALAIRLARVECARLSLDATLPVRLAAIVPKDAAAMSVLAGALLEAHEAWIAGDLGRTARLLVRRLGVLAAVVRDVPPRDARAASQRLKGVCDALAAAQRTARALGAAAAPDSFVMRLDEILNAVAFADAAKDRPGVRVMTVHAAKGLEFQRVFVADAVQGRFPRVSRPTSLLDKGDRALLACNGVDGLSVAPEGGAREDASLWYVAVTRCSERLSISFADVGVNGDPQRASSFLAEGAPKLQTPVERRSLLLRALTGSADTVRSSVDVAIDAADIPMLSDYARLGDAAFAPCDATLVRYAKALSVSDATTWLQCPRKVYYGKFLRLPTETSAAQQLGSILHAVLEHFHERRTTFGARGPTSDQFASELWSLRRDSWDSTAFASTALADACAQAADVALYAYARALVKAAEMRSFEVEAREYSVNIPVGDEWISGRIDRLDRYEDGTRAIVDYKSGGEKPSPASAAGKLVAAWLADDKAGVARRSLVGNLPENLDLQLAFYASAFDDISTLVKVYLAGATEVPDRSGVAAIESTPYADAIVLAARGALEEFAREAIAPLRAGTLAMVPTTRRATVCAFCTFSELCIGPTEESS